MQKLMSTSFLLEGYDLSQQIRRIRLGSELGELRVWHQHRNMWIRQKGKSFDPHKALPVRGGLSAPTREQRATG